MSETEAAAAAAAVKKIERGHQMYRDGEHQEALGYYTEALAMAKTKPQMIALHSNRAACYLKLHDFKKAAEECTLVLELDQEHTGALMLRAQTLVTLKEYNSALFDVNRLMELNPSSDVYQNLQARLKTQLLLAPIPECEEESSMSELEDDEIEEGEAIALADKKTEDTTTTSNPEAPFSQIQSFEDVPNTHSRKGDALQDPDESSKPVIAFEDQKKSAPGVPESPASRAIPRPMADKKTEITGTICNPEAPVSQTQSYRGISKVDSEGWKAIPKPKGHSNLDYSRWDRVEDDSSEDEEDEDKESLPQYRFRVKTVGVRPVR